MKTLTTSTNNFLPIVIILLAFGSCVPLKKTAFVTLSSFQANTLKGGIISQNLADQLLADANRINDFAGSQEKLSVFNCPCQGCPCPPCLRPPCPPSTSLNVIDSRPIPENAITILDLNGKSLISLSTSRSFRVAGENFYFRSFKLNKKYDGPANLFFRGILGTNNNAKSVVNISSGGVISPQK